MKMLNLEEVKNSVLVGSVRENDIFFTDLDKLQKAINSVNDYLTADEFKKEDYQLSHDKATRFIAEWKNEHSQKVREVIQKKEAERKAKLERVTAAKKLFPKLDKTFKEFESVINEIRNMDKNVLQGLFYGSGNHHNREFEEALKDLKECVEKTIKG